MKSVIRKMKGYLLLFTFCNVCYILLASYQLHTGSQLEMPVTSMAAIAQRQRLSMTLYIIEFVIFFIVCAFSVYFLKRSENLGKKLFQFSVVNMTYIVFCSLLLILIGSGVGTSYGNLIQQFTLPFIYCFILFIMSCFLLFREKMGQEVKENI